MRRVFVLPHTYSQRYDRKLILENCFIVDYDVWTAHSISALDPRLVWRFDRRRYMREQLGRATSKSEAHL